MKRKKFGKEIYLMALMVGLLIIGGWTMSGCGTSEEEQQKIVSKFIDSDNDGLSDNDEIMKYHTGLASRDTDGDGLLDGDEVNIYGTDPLSSDTDGDGMPDGWELQYGLNPLVNDAGQDPDGDGRTNLQEYQAGTDPRNPDTDGDGMPDGWEVQHGLNPTTNDADWDNDSDGLTNYQEYLHGTLPNNPDTDGDTFQDGFEVLYGFDPLNPNDPAVDPDSDQDGIPDQIEADFYHTDPGNADTDGDGYPDKFEVDNGSDPTRPGSVPDVTKVVINEVFSGTCAWIELHNMGSHPVALGNWEVWINQGGITTKKKISDSWGNFTLEPKNVAVLDTGNGTNTSTHRYANACGTICDTGSYGAITLISNGNGMDGVLWGWRGLVTPSVFAAWQDGPMIAYYCPAGDSLKRDRWGTDTDSAKDWSVGFPTPGEINSPDSDGDGLSDWAEENVYHTDQVDADTDGDGYPDGLEVEKGTDPDSASGIPSGIIPEVEPNGTANQCTAVGDLSKQVAGQLYPRDNSFTEFYEDFSDGTYTDTFQALGGGTANLRNYGGHTNALCVYGNANNIHAYTKQSFSGDMIVEFDYYLAGTAGDGGVFFGVKDADNGALMALRTGGWEIYDRGAGQWIGLTGGQINNLTLTQNTWDHFRIEVRGGVYSVFENGNYRGFFRGAYNVGFVGLRGIQNSAQENCIDNVRVTSIPPQPENYYEDFTSEENLQIISAMYGKNGSYCDATSFLQSRCDGRASCNVYISSAMCGDPLVGVTKEVVIYYKSGNNPRSPLVVTEGQNALISSTFNIYSVSSFGVKSVGNHSAAFCASGGDGSSQNIITANRAFGDAVIDFDYYLNMANWGGILIRAQDRNNGVLIELGPNSWGWKAWRMNGGSWTQLSTYNTSNPSLVPYQWTHLTIVMEGSKVTLFEKGVNRGYFLTYIPSWPDGAIGLRTVYGEQCIDNVRVTPLPREFSEDFSKGAYTNNFVEDSGGNQSVKSIGGHDQALCSYGHSANDIHLYTPQTFADGAFEFDYYLASGASDGGVFLRSQDRNNGLLISLDPASWQAYARVNGNWTDIWKYNYSALTIGNNHWHHFKVLMYGNRFDLYEEGAFRGTFYNGNYPRGSIGLRGLQGWDWESCIDNIRVTPGVSDTNYYCFNALAGQTKAFKIQADSLGFPVDSDILLYETDGTTVLARNDDRGKSYSGALDSLLPYTFTANGTYFLTVQGSGLGREAYHPYFLDIQDSNPAQDFDGDGLTDTYEINTSFTNPDNPDTDGDGLTDGNEVNLFLTNPKKPDSDDDGLTDYQEVCYDSNCSAYAPGADPNPNNPDTDGDTYPDGKEVGLGYNPLDPASHPAFLTAENGVEIGETYNYLPVDSIQTRALKACESHWGTGNCCVATGGYKNEQYSLCGGIGGIHWQWGFHPAGHCGPFFVPGDVVNPGWCGSVIGSFID